MKRFTYASKTSIDHLVALLLPLLFQFGRDSQVTRSTKWTRKRATAWDPNNNTWAITSWRRVSQIKWIRFLSTKQRLLFFPFFHTFSIFVKGHADERERSLCEKNQKFEPNQRCYPWFNASKGRCAMTIEDEAIFCMLEHKNGSPGKWWYVVSVSKWFEMCPAAAGSGG